MDIATKVFKAVANEKRIKILKLLLKENDEMSVESIAKSLKIGYKTASQHLQKLANVGLVKKRQKGLHAFYSINYEDSKIFNSAILDVLKDFYFLNK